MQQDSRLWDALSVRKNLSFTLEVVHKW